MEKKPVVVAKRLTELREGIHVSQARLAAVFGLDQPAIFRYENAQSFPPYGVLMKYADFFNVSMDYIFGRTDSPRGMLYEPHPALSGESDSISALAETCFEPGTVANIKLKKAVLQILQELQNNESDQSNRRKK